ncbi:hypothetical protein BC629DRAFT_1514542 [Irpex lacteus]|nr:hypothetical protein BC629DRAFT_1514542 [Irpex lacteus]
MFATNFTVHSDDLRYTRRRGLLKTYSQSKTIASYNGMTNYFFSDTLLNRVYTRAPTQASSRAIYRYEGGKT